MSEDEDGQPFVTRNLLIATVGLFLYSFVRNAMRDMSYQNPAEVLGGLLGAFLVASLGKLIYMGLRGDGRTRDEPPEGQAISKEDE